MSSHVRTRVAPSPTGFPHIGTAYQAIFDLVFARQNRGKFILRIEDTDQDRYVDGAEKAIFRALDWLSLSPDESPVHGGSFGPYRQSERLPIYKKYVDQLIESGGAYYCFCSQERLDQVRQEQQAAHQASHYDRFCRNLSLLEAKKRVHNGDSYVVRLKVPLEQEIVVKDLIRGSISFQSDKIDDQILLKSDGFPTYHLAVVVDDHLMKITHAVRGEEWLPSAPKHILLYQYFNWPEPFFVHLPILRGTDRSKISKRDGYTSIEWYRQQGFLPQALVNFLASIVWTHPQEKDIFSFEELTKLFRWEDINIAAPIFDLRKLEWMNGEYLRCLSHDEFGDIIVEWLLNEGADLCSAASKEAKDNPARLIKVALLFQERLKKLAEFEELTSYFFKENTGVSDETLLSLLDKRGVNRDTSLSQLQQSGAALESLDHWSLEAIERILENLKDTNDWQAKNYFMVLRIAVTTREVSPPLFETIACLDRNLVMKRLYHCQNILQSG